MFQTVKFVLAATAVATLVGCGGGGGGGGDGGGSGSGGGIAVTTLAGTGANGSVDGAGANATFSNPWGVAVDSSGTVYVADAGNSPKIRKITAAGVVSTLAGTGVRGSTDGAGVNATFDTPRGIAVDANGNVYVGDESNFNIRKISAAGVVSTLAGTGVQGSADGAGASATFYSVGGVAVDANGNVYVADAGNSKIRKITAAGVVSTLAGTGVRGSTDGVGVNATFSNPWGVAVDANGNVYVADLGNNKIRKITAAGVVSTLAGTGAPGSADGSGASATFDWPHGVAVDTNGNVYVGDVSNKKIRKITQQ